MDFLGQGIATFGVWVATAAILVIITRAQASVFIALAEKGKKVSATGGLLDLVVLGCALLATAIIWNK